MSTSAPSSSRQSRAWPSALVRSRVMSFFDRLVACHTSERSYQSAPSSGNDAE